VREEASRPYNPSPQHSSNVRKMPHSFIMNENCIIRDYRLLVENHFVVRHLERDVKRKSDRGVAKESKLKKDRETKARNEKEAKRKRNVDRVRGR
jgi:hypothetical protein